MSSSATGGSGGGDEVQAVAPECRKAWVDGGDKQSIDVLICWVSQTRRG